MVNYIGMAINRLLCIQMVEKNIGWMVKELDEKIDFFAA